MKIPQLPDLLMSSGARYIKAKLTALAALFITGSVVTLQAASPTVNLNPLPTGTPNFLQGSQIVYTAVAVDPDGTDIVSYRFEGPGGQVQDNSSNVFVFNANIAGASQTIMVTATDGDGETGIATREITVLDRGNTPIRVTLTSPTTNSQLRIGESFAASGTFDSSGQTVASAILIENGLFASSTTSPTGGTFSFDETADAAGTFTYYAMVTLTQNIDLPPDANGNVVTVPYTLSNVSQASTVVVSNAPLPVISILTPSTSDTVAFGVEGIVQASVSPVDSASQLLVEFFAEGVSIGTASSEPFEVKWTPDTTGPITLTAELTEGTTTVQSSPVDVNVVVGSTLSVTISQPIDFAEFDVGESITFGAVVGSETGIVSVDYFANGVAITGATGISTAPYTAEWPLDTTGRFIITARVTEGTRTSTSDGIIVQVFDPSSARPTVSIDSPTTDDTVPPRVTLDISASASSDVAGITQVEFRVDGVSIGVDTTFPYTASFAPDASDKIVIQAIATDTNGAIASASVFVEAVTNNRRGSITTPAAGSQFSVFQTIPIQIFASQENEVRLVEFFANGTQLGSASFAPFLFDYEPNEEGDTVIAARISYRDGTQITTDGVPLQIVFNPTVTIDDFVGQSLADFFAKTPTDTEVQEFSQGFGNTLDERVRFISTLTTTGDFGAAVSIIGAFEVQLYRFPTPVEYQEAIAGLGFGNGDDTDGIVAVAVPSQTVAAINTAGDEDVYSFTVQDAQIITLFTEGPLDTFGTLETTTGTIIAVDDDDGEGLNFQISQFLAAGTYNLRVRAFSSTATGIYTLFVDGIGDTTGTGGTTGSSNFDLTGFTESIYTSSEYIAKFGQLPVLTGLNNGSAGDLNRRLIFSQLWAGKYGGSPSDLQQQQASIRMTTLTTGSTLSGLDVFTAIFVSEQNVVITDLNTGQSSEAQPLIFDAPTRRDWWTTAALIEALWNTQPTFDLVSSLFGMPLSEQIESIITDPRYLTRFPPADSILFSAEIFPQLDGWVASPWFGNVNINSEPWYFSETLSWVFTTAMVPESVWFYSPELGWFWTSDKVYPFIYINDEAAWFYVLGSEDGYVFLYDVNTDTVITRFVG